MNYNVYSSTKGIVVKDEDGKVYILTNVDPVEEGIDEETMMRIDRFEDPLHVHP